MQKYYTIRCNKLLTVEAKSPEEMIIAYQNAIIELKEMQDDGLEFDFQGACDDFIDIFTSDPLLAEKHGLLPYSIDDDGNFI